MPSQLEILHRSLKANNYDVPDDYESFRSTLTAKGEEGYNNRYTLWKSLRANNYDVPDDYNTFRDALFMPTKPAAGAQQKTPPAAVPQGTQRQAAGRGTTTNRTAAKPTTTPTSTKTANTMPEGFGDLSPEAGLPSYMQEEAKKRREESYGTNPAALQQRRRTEQTFKAVRGDREAAKEVGLDRVNQQLRDRMDYTMATGKELKHVLDEAAEAQNVEKGLDLNALGIAPTVARDEQGNIVYGEDGQPLRGQVSDEVRAGTQMVEEQRVRQADLQAQIDEANAELARLQEEAQKVETPDYVFGQDALSPYADPRTSNSDLAAISAARRQTEERIKALQEEMQGGRHGFFSGVMDAAKDPSTWLIGLDKVGDNMNMLAVSEKVKNGQQLTQAEQAMLDATIANNAVQQRLEEDSDWLYRSGRMTTEMIPFMGQIMFTGGYGSVAAVGERMGQKWATAYARKFGEKALMNRINMNLLRGFGIGMGDVAAGFASANTTGAVNTLNNAMQRRIGQLGYDEEGDYAFTNDEDWLRAIMKAEVSQTKEFATERFGEHLPGLRRLNVMLAKQGPRARTIARALSGFAGTKAMQKTAQWLRKGGVNGVFGEVLEEEIGLPVDVAIGDMTWEDALSGKTQWDIVGGMLMSIGAMHSVGLAAQGVDKGYNTAQYYRYKREADKASSAAAFRMTAEKWEPLKESIDGTTSEDMSALWDEIRGDEGLSVHEKRAAYDYINALTQMRGYNMGMLFSAREAAKDGRLTPGETTPEEAVEMSVLASGDEGYETLGPERNEVLKRYEAARQAVAEVFGIDEEEVDSRLGIDENSENAIADKALQVDFGEQVLEYLNARAAYNGMLDRVGDDIEAQVQASNEEVSRITNETGQVVGATMRADGSQVYVVSGDPATAETLVVRNAETGELKMIAPDALQNIEEPINADELRLQREEEITNAGMQQAENEIEGKREFQLNDVVTLADGRQGQLGGVTPDGAFLLYTDDGKVTPVTNDQLNELATEVNGSPVEAVTQSQQTEEAEEEQPEEASGTENAENYAQNEGEIIPEEEAAIVSQKTEQEAEGTGEQPVVDADAMPMVGEGEDAEPDFSRAEPARAHRFIYDEAGLSRDEADQFIDANKKEADSALAKLQKKQPKIGTSLAKYRKEQAAWQQQVDEAQRQVDYWTNVQQIQQERMRAEQEAEFQARQEEAAGRQALLDEQRDLQAKIQTAKRVYGDYFDDDFTVPHDVMELVALNMPRNISWEGREGVRGLQQELGLKRGVGRNADSNAFNAYLAKKGEGIGVEQAVHNIWESAMNELPNGEKRYDDSEIRNALLDMFMSAEKPSDIRDYVLNVRIAEAENMRAAEDEAMKAVAELDAWADAYHLTPEEREDFEDYISSTGEEISRMSDEEIQNIITIFANANQNTIDYEQNRRSQEVDREPDGQRAGREGEGSQAEVQGQGTEETGVPDSYQQGTEGSEAAGNREDISGDNVSGGALERPDVDEQRMKAIRQALTDAYRSGDKTAIGLAAEQVQAYVDEGLDDYRAYDEAIDDYEGREPEMLADQYITHVFLDRYVDDDEDQEYIVTGLKPWMRESPASVLPNMEVEEAALASQQTEQPSESKSERILTDGLINFLDQIGVEDLTVVDRMSNDEKVKLDNLITDWEEVNDEYGRVIEENRDKIHSLNKAEKKKAENAVDAAQKRADTAFAPVEEYVNELVTKYKVEEPEEDVSNDAEVMAQQTENTLGTTSSAEEIAAQEARVDTNPTEAQKEAGNYQKGHIKVDGYDITIENPKGSVRRGTDASGQPWEVTMNNTYGYIRGTEGVDGDHIDVFLSDEPTSGNVFVVDQVNPDGSFDEHKVMYGFASEEEARAAYLANYSPGWQGLGGITEVSREEFKKWVESSHRKTKPFAEYAIAKAAVQKQQTERQEQKQERDPRYHEGWDGNYEQWKRRRDYLDEIERKEKAAAEEGRRAYYVSSSDSYGQRNGVFHRVWLMPEDVEVGTNGEPYYAGRMLWTQDEAYHSEEGYQLGNIYYSGEELLGKRKENRSNAAVAQQQTEQREAAANFTITDAEYKTKRGKVLNMRLVKFERELTPEEQKAANALAKESRGWWSREDGGFLMRDDESARAFAEKVMTPTDMTDAKPLSLEDMQKATDDRQEQQPEPTLQAEQPVQEEQQPARRSQWVDDEDAARFEELKRRMRAKLGGQMNMGVDPEILAIGAEMAFYVVKHGARKFGEYARVMVEELGDAIRPYLKSFYNGAREFPEMEQYAEDMTPYEEVRAFDVANFDKPVMDVVATAQQIVNEQEAEQQAEEAEKNLKDQRNEERKQVEQENTRPATPEDLEQAPLVWYQGKKYGIMMLVHEGSQVSATQFEKPRIVRVVLSNGQSVEPDELRVDNTVQAPVEEAEPVQYDLFGNPIQEPVKKSSRKTEKKSAKVSDSQEKVVSLQKENDVNDEAANAEQQNAGIRHEQGSERKPSGTGERAGQEAQRADDIRRREGSEPNRSVQPGLQRLTQEVATQSQQNERNTDWREPNGDASEPVPTRPGSELSGSGSHSTQFTQPQNLRNNRAERGKDYAPKGVDARIEANINAIELMQRLMENGEQATPAQMKVLRQYSGWGGLGKAFKEKVSSGDSGYNPRLPDGLQPANPINVRLRELLSPEEYDAANMSRNSAYYTPAMVIDSMWDIARAMGFRGGNVLEGSAGIGNIIGAMPKDMSERSSIHAVEIDQTTGNILSLLYPDAQVDVQGFEQTQVENGSVDLAITNVPFVTGLRVMDTTGDKDLSRKFHDIHDFCIAKNIRKLREGGIGIFITSSGTLDNSTKLREWIVGEGGADVVGAFRLNNDTFGGTGATSDIIVVRKRVNGKKSANAIDVLPTTGVRVADYNTGETKKVKGEYVPVVKQLSMDYNKYFAEHPENMGGEMKFAFEEGDTFRPTSKALYPVRGKNQEELLKDWVTSFAGKEWEAAVVQQQTEQQPAVYEKLGADVKEGSMVVINGELCVAQRGKAVPLGLNATKVKGKTKVECFNSYQNIKKSLADVLVYQTENEGDEGLKPLLDKLNRAYDGFVRTFGHLHKNTSIAFLRNDVDWPNILALEKFAERATVDGKRVQEYGKTDIFKARVVEKEKEPTVDNVRDGIIASIYQFGRIDVPWMVEQLNKAATRSQHTEQEVRDEIVKSGLGFEDPGTKEIIVSYEYLSGNVREKLQQAQDNNSDGRYDANIKALEKVVPMDIPAHLIDFSIGSSWIDPKLYEDYVKEKTGIDVQFTNAGGTWYMKAPRFLNEEKNRAMGVHSEMLRKTVFGTQLIEAAMQNKTITVSETHKKWDGSTETIIDKEATAACGNKIDEIRQDFKDWARGRMQADDEYARQVERKYNDMFNNYVPKSIPDEFVPAHFGGATTKITLRPHQAKAVIRGTTQPLLLAHEVGTGKTFTLISTAMEMRRLGTARKPMIVVQNATVGQFVESAKVLYPNAKVLTLEDKDHTGEGRKNFYAKIKYNDWDMIVVPQSVFERIPDSEERQMAYIQDKIDEKMAVLEQMKDADAYGESAIVRQAEKEIEQLQAEKAALTTQLTERKKEKDEKKAAVTRQNAAVRAQEMLDRETDDVENFDDMGIDAILVDEAHEYKHLGFATAMQRGVKGVDPSYSKKAQGVYLKTQAVLEKNNGRNVIFATGTPISNTAAEIWTFMRYLMPADTMKEYDIYYFDDFVRNFGNLQQMLEFTTSGKFKENNRFAGYVNLPELVRIWSGVADTVLTKEAGGVKDKIPELEGGKAQDLYLPQTKALRSVMKYVKAQLEEYEKMSGKEKKENSHIPLTMYGIAKAAAVDARLVVDDAQDDEHSKTNEAVRQTLKSLDETKSYKGTVAIFADNYQNKHSGFNLYEDIRKKLVAAGVPEEQIVVMKSGMSVKKKLEIFDKVNRGEVRVIMGSTFTLGTGVNIQERLHTLIHVDAPNRPMDYTQRNGRILRQGNLHKEMGKPVRVLRFGVEDSLDVTAYQRLKTKGAIADSIMNGKQMMANSMENRVLEEEEDVFGDTVAQLSGSEYAMLKNQAEKDVRKYEAKRKQWEFDQTYVHSQIPKLEGQIKTTQKAIENNKRYLERVATVSQHTGPMITIGQRKFENVEAMGDYIKDFNKSVKAAEDAMRESGKNDSQVRRLTINVGGIDFEIVTEISVEIFTKGVQLFTGTHRVMTYSCEELGIADAPVKQSLLREALSDITENVITGNDFRERIERGERAIERDEDTLQQLRERDGKPFEYADELAKAHERYDEYTELMKKELEEKEKKYAEMDAEVSEAADVVDAEEAEEDSSEDEGVRFRSGDGDDLLYRLREEPAPEKTGIGYKVFVLKDGMLYPPMVANPNGAETPVGVWLDADAAPVAGTSKTGRLQVKAGGKGTQGGSGKLAYRPGWHLGTIPYALQFNRNNPETGERELFPANFVWAEVEYANDVDYQEEAMSYGYNQNGKFQHSLAGLPRVPKDGAYTYRTNPNPATDPWIITGAMKVNRILKPSEVDQLVRDAGREPQPRQEGAITDEQVEALNNELGTLNREGEEIPATQRKRARTARERRQAEAYAQRQWRRAHVVADEAIKLFGLEDRVTVMDFPIGLTGKRAKAKGWYDTKTGKIVVVMNNHRSPEDVFKTILHEGVAHYGLRQLFGEHFDTFLDEVYKNATPEIRGAIDAEVATRSQQTEQKARREATEEYLARLAEETDFERAMRQGWWQKIKSAFLDMLHKLGFGDYAGPALTDNELRYILWRSYENLKDQKREREGQRSLRRNVWNPFKAAEDIVMQENLKVGNFEPTPSPSLKGREKEQRQAAEPKRPTLSVASIQPRNAVEQMYQDFKERYGNAMLMMRDNDNYFALGDDALKMERLFAGRRFIHGVMSDGRYSIPVSELDMVLPVLVRAGNRVAIADAPTGNTAREGEPEVEWQDSRRIMERLAERYNSKELVFFDLTMDDEELFESLSFLHPFRNELNDVEDFSDFMAFVREKLNEDKAQAFYNVDSKKIFIFADRLKPKKAEEVFFHENIHGVLHDWYGDGARTIADRFWNIAPEKGKTNKSHVTANYDAEEQHEELFTYWLAKSMVDGSVDDMLNMFADADKQRIENILKTIGYDRERETEERKPRGAEDVSERAGGESLQGLQVQETIGYDKGRENSTRRRIYPSVEGRNSQDQGDQLQGSLQDPDEEDLGIRFRSGDGGGFTSARAQYEAKTAGGAFKFRESWQDSMLSLKRLQDAIAAESGEDIEDFENAYLAENRMHGKSKNEAEHYDRNYYQPLLQEVHQLVDYLAEQEVADPFGRGGVVTYQTVDDYLKAKHGLERNQVFAFREAAKQKAKETIDEQKRQLQQDADDGNITTDELRKELKRLDEDFGKTVQGIIDAFANDPEVVRQKRNYENGLLTYSEYLSALIPLRKKYVMRAEPKTDDGGNVVSDNYYDEHERDYGGLSELMSPEDYATIEALREMASLTIDPENKRELYKRVREEEERVFREAQEEAMKAVDAIEVDSTMKEKRDNGTIVPFVYLRDTAERRKHISDLWSRVNDATKKTLQTSYEGGMMSREQYNNVRAMFDYYVPLRGWEDNNAEDVYDYVAKRSAFSPSVKKAYGRASKADSPLATIGNMAVSQVIISNKNLMRQHFLNMVLNHPSSLISVSEKWYVRMGDVDGEAVWEEREPDIKPGMTADEIASEIETFNEEMRQLQEQGDAIPAKGKLHLNLHATKAQKDEHVVEVQRNGKVYKLYINGNPRAAQALNGTNITEGDAAWMQKLSRTMAANFTSRNPAFIISNLSRDFTMAAASVVIKEDKAYSKKFAENAVKVLRPRMGRAATRSQRTMLTGLLPSLMRKYLRGELDPSDETERYFQEFMEQGGETGFTNMLSVDKFKSKIEKEFKKTAGHEMDLAKAFGMMADTFEFYNRCAEDATRFIVYMTSRQMGKSVTKSIADAKDVTLNFNRKGAGGMGNATFRNIYIFVNPAIQALSNVYEMMTKHKLKFTAVTLSWVAAGAVLPILNTLMLNLLGGDDDKDTYWDLPDYVRKNNAVFWVPGTHTFVTIPLAQEFRVFYGIGELASAMSMGHTPDSWGKETLSSFMDLLPVNPTGAGGDLLVDFMPTPLQPIVQARDNINFTGYPIYRDNQGNKYEPTWQKAYHGTPSWMVKTSKMLNEATGGNDHYQGWIDGTLTNPALWNHMLQGYLGGMYSFLAHSAGVATDVVSGEMPKMYEVPIANRFINVPLEREKRARLGNEYYDLVKEHDRMQSMMAKYRKDAKGEDPELKETAERYVDMAKEIDKKIDWERNGKTYEPQTSIDAGFEKRYRRYKKIHDYKRSIEKVVNGESKKSENRLNQLVREMQESLRNINEDF